MFDLVVLGGGPGGYVAAIRGAQEGLKVALVEKNRVGGTCLNRGCIPTKSLLASTEVLHKVKNAENFGINVEGFSYDFSKIMERKNSIVDSLVDGIEFILKHHGIEVFNGHGKFLDKNTILVGEEKVCGKNIIIATGSEAATIKSLGFNGRNVVTSTELLSIDRVPKEMIIIGAGVIGCEFASIFSELGTKITIIEALDRVLPMADKDISKRYTTLLKKEKIKIMTGVMVESVKEIGEDLVTVQVSNGKEVSGDLVLIGIGRVLNSQDLGLENTNVTLSDRGVIETDDGLRTKEENIYAIGDVNNRSLLAHSASYQGLCVVESIVTGTKDTKASDTRYVPSCIYTRPEISFVGLNEEEAKEKFKENVLVGNVPFKVIGKAKCIGETDGFVKIISRKDDDVLLGVHIMGPHATDLISEATIAIKKGLTVSDLVNTIHPHPTISEAIMEAAEAVHGKAIHMI